MRIKKFEKKLTFNKKTIAHLNIVQLSNVKGGKLIDPIPATNPTRYCPSCAWHIIYGCV